LEGIELAAVKRDVDTLVARAIHRVERGGEIKIGEPEGAVCEMYLAHA